MLVVTEGGSSGAGLFLMLGSVASVSSKLRAFRVRCSRSDSCRPGAEGMGLGSSFVSSAVAAFRMKRDMALSMPGRRAELGLGDSGIFLGR